MRPEPSTAWVWDKFKEYNELNDASHGRLLALNARTDTRTQELLMLVRDLEKRVKVLEDQVAVMGAKGE